MCKQVHEVEGGLGFWWEGSSDPDPESGRVSRGSRGRKAPPTTSVQRGRKAPPTSDLFASGQRLEAGLDLGRHRRDELRAAVHEGRMTNAILRMVEHFLKVEYLSLRLRRPRSSSE